MKPSNASGKKDSWAKNAVVMDLPERFIMHDGFTYCHVPGLDCYVRLPNKDADKRARALRASSRKKVRRSN